MRGKRTVSGAPVSGSALRHTSARRASDRAGTTGDAHSVLGVLRLMTKCGIHFPCVSFPERAVEILDADIFQ